jgi:hypothetical protein
MKNFYFALLLVGLVAVSCAPRNYVREPINNLSYVIGTSSESPVGSIMISRETGLKVCWDYWAGLVNGGYLRVCDDSIDRFKEDLIYAGRAGSIIKIAYKEYKGKESFYLARPAFFQELTYDLGTSSVIVFRNFRITILGADNEKIVFVVEKD